MVSLVETYFAFDVFGLVLVIVYLAAHVQLLDEGFLGVFVN